MCVQQLPLLLVKYNVAVCSGCCVIAAAAAVSQVRKMQEAGYVIGNLDCTIIAQKPKLSPHKVRSYQHRNCC